MVEVPNAAPVTTPVVEPMVTLVLLLLQVPPGVLLESVIESPIQTLDGPVIPDGPGLTVTVTIRKQPVGKV